jgi:hypothetical protein
VDFIKILLGQEPVLLATDRRSTCRCYAYDITQTKSLSLWRSAQAWPAIRPLPPLSRGGSQGTLLQPTDVRTRTDAKIECVNIEHLMIAYGSHDNNDEGGEEKLR